MKLVQPIRKVAQIQRMKEIVSDNPRNALLLEMGFHTALRVSDILSLRVPDVAKKAGGKWRIARYYVMTERKTRKSKQIELIAPVRAAILRQVESLDAGQQADGWLFPSPYKGGVKHLTRRQAGRLVKKTAAEAGVYEPAACHSLRKTFGYHAFRSGVDVMYLKELFNHADLEITKRYIGITQDELKSVYQRVGAILG